MGGGGGAVLRNTMEKFQIVSDEEFRKRKVKFGVCPSWWETEISDKIECCQKYMRIQLGNPVLESGKNSGK